MGRRGTERKREVGGRGEWVREGKTNLDKVEFSPFFPPSLDNPSLQDDVLHFISTVLVLDHPRLCKHLRTNILAIKVTTVY